MTQTRVCPCTHFYSRQRVKQLPHLYARPLVEVAQHRSHALRQLGQGSVAVRNLSALLLDEPGGVVSGAL